MSDSPDTAVSIDLEKLTASAGDKTIPVQMPDSARDALVTGQWDYLGQLLSAEDQVSAHSSTIPYLNGFKA